MKNTDPCNTNLSSRTDLENPYCTIFPFLAHWIVELEVCNWVHTETQKVLSLIKNVTLQGNSE